MRHVLNTIVTQHGYTGQAGIPTTDRHCLSKKPTKDRVCLHQKGRKQTQMLGAKIQSNFLQAICLSALCKRPKVCWKSD